MLEQGGRAEEARRVKLALSGLGALAVLPSVAAEAATLLFEDPFSPSQLTGLVETSPVMAARVLTLAHEIGVDVEERGYSLTQVLDRLPADKVRTAVLSLDLYFRDTEQDIPSDCLLLPREDLELHSLAVAVCSRMIAEAMVVGTDVRLAYLAGLLHDIGKLAMHQLMPLGFAGIVHQCLQDGARSFPIERASLGLDHGVIGKYLARRWCLPSALQRAIWLHHTDMASFDQRSGYVDVARIVYCADAMVNALQIGRSGSFDRSLDLERLAALVAVDSARLTEIHERLEDSVEQQAAPLKLDMQNPCQRLSRLALRGAARLSSGKWASQERDVLGQVQGQLDFFKALLQDVRRDMDAMEVGEAFARRWQQHFQTGKVLLFFASTPAASLLDTVLLDELGDCQQLLLEDDQDIEGLIQAMAGKLGGLDEADFTGLWERIDSRFSLERCQCLAISPRFRAGLLFERGYPNDAEDFEERFAQSVKLGRCILEFALTRDEQESFADDFACLTRSEPHPATRTDGIGWFNALAEMAAGLAHELNNPLSVIFGRAQLLLAAERDEERVRSLQQIEENAQEMSQIVEDLISFAEPPTPRRQNTAVHQVVEEAIQLAALKSGREEIAVLPTLSESVHLITVDSGQIVSALANILVNAVESYAEQEGVVHLEAVTAASGTQVVLSIRDQGCGMDALTLKHASTPFFSAKAAGRQRGMGLAYAARVIELNHGTLSLASQKDQGTTVTVTLPTT